MSDRSRGAAAVVTAAVGAVLLVLGPRAAAAEPPRLDLVWVDPTGIARGTFDDMATESRSVLAALGADVAWREGSTGLVIGPESMAVIAVHTYAGTRLDPHVMGATRRGQDGHLAVWVFPDQVAWALGLDIAMRASWGSRSETMFARALARVASHEVVHALGVASHARTGLMTAVLDRRALEARELAIDRHTVATARRELARSALAASGPWAATLRASVLPARDLALVARPVR
jgi:hypothetical protein